MRDVCTVTGAEPIGPSMPCAHVECVAGQFLVVVWDTTPDGRGLTPRMFERELWMTDHREWLEWKPVDFKREERS